MSDESKRPTNAEIARDLCADEYCQLCHGRGSHGNWECNSCIDIANALDIAEAHGAATERAARIAAESALATARAEAAALREGLRAIVAARQCGDSSCNWGRRGGMMTNGGCRDDKDMDRNELRRALHKVARELRALLASPEARDAGEGGGCDE